MTRKRHWKCKSLGHQMVQDREAGFVVLKCANCEKVDRSGSIRQWAKEVWIRDREEKADRQ